MIGIVDYQAGNLTSVARALDYLKIPWVISSDPEKLKSCEKIIFPGVGAACSAMESLIKFGLDDFLKEAFYKGVPIMGICLGTQIIMEESEEDGGTKTLGLISGRVRRFPYPLIEDGKHLKVPHMGWNSVSWLKEHPLLKEVEPDYEYYFVHSYYPQPENSDIVLGVTSHGITFPSGLAYKNLVAFQFHPEKSGRPGLKLIKNFYEWKV